VKTIGYCISVGFETEFQASACPSNSARDEPPGLWSLRLLNASKKKLERAPCCGNVPDRAKRVKY
jgi:hypothetical protein